MRGYEDPVVFVVSAFKGVTERLAHVVDSPVTGGSEAERRALIDELRELYGGFAAAIDAPFSAYSAARLHIERILGGLERALAASDGARALAASERTRVLATGERLAATCVSLALVSIGRPAAVIEPGKLGLVARPSAGSEWAVADIELSAPRIRSSLGLESTYGAQRGETRLSIRSAVVPGFYGVAEDGQPHLFGRGGSDYSAAVIAACIGASSCDLIKDVNGVYTADPSLVTGARPVVELSYDEAEALARGGAKILHHRCIAPLRDAGVPLRILGGSSRARTYVGASFSDASLGPRAVALARGPIGGAEITVAGGSASQSAPVVLKAFEASGLAARAFYPGSEGASFRLLVDAAKGDEALKVAHRALFG